MYRRVVFPDERVDALLPGVGTFITPAGDKATTLEARPRRCDVLRAIRSSCVHDTRVAIEHQLLLLLLLASQTCTGGKGITSNIIE